MKFWLLSVAVLFVLAQLYQWAMQYTFPLPVYVIAGAFLAIASNYDKGITGTSSAAPIEEGKSQPAPEELSGVPSSASDPNSH